MTSYLNHLEQVYNPQTFQRKISYLKSNISGFLRKFNHGELEILEIGPGMGEFEQLLNSQRIETIDIVDNDKTVLNYIDQKFKIRNKYLCSKLTEIDKQLKNYDLILMIQVLEHIPLAQQSETIKVLVKHLKTQGRLIIVVPNGGNPLSIVERYSDIQHTCIFTEQSLKDLVYSLNEPNLEVEVKGFKIPSNNIINILRIFLQKILHLMLKLLLIVNGGVYFNIMTPNIMLIVRKNEK